MRFMKLVRELYADAVPEPLPRKARQEGAFLVAMPLETNGIYYLRHKSAFVLSRCNGETPVSDILDEFADHYFMLSEDEAAFQAIAYLRDLRQRGLVRLFEDAPA